MLDQGAKWQIKITIIFFIFQGIFEQNLVQFGQRDL
jgi:hypothetical protein